MAADIACWDFSGVDRIGVDDPVAALLFTGLSQIAQLVLVNGQIVVHGGQPTRVESAEVARRADDLIPVGDGLGTAALASG
jgi:8-oxoguanine deaminase